MKRMMICLLLAFTICVAMPFKTAAMREDRSVVHVKTEERIVALTFDDGPHPRYTPRILGVLEKYDVKATFFMVGINVERYPDAARAVALAGHEIGNHTDTHPRIGGMQDDAVRDSVEACARRILDTTGVRTNLFRPPEGALSASRYCMLEEMGYKQILWNADTLDWQGCKSDAIVKTVMSKVRCGDIILFHDYVSGRLQSDRALETIIPALQAQGYRFVTISELLERGEIVYPHF